jgi:hypothetical protein
MDGRRAMSTTWVATRLGMDPVRVNAMRRGGELLAVRPQGTFEWLYPSWQFDAEGRPLPSVARVVRAAREVKLRENELAALLDQRVGIVAADRRLVDVLLEGDEESVLAAIRRSGQARAARG